MQVNDQLRLDMLNVAKASIEDGTADHKIIFKDAGDIPLAELEFKDLVSFGADYKFRAPDDTYALRTAVIADGRAVSFAIEGKINGGVDVALSGSVGSLISNADIRFNKQDWATGASITLNNLIIFIKQGT